MNGRIVASTGSYSAVGWDLGQTRIGSCQITCPGGGASRNADGVIDEPHIYTGMGSSGNPDTLAYAGLLSDGRESLASPSSNVALLGSSVVAGNKGQYLYFGSDSTFRGLNVALATPGVWSTPGDLVWEFWNGTQWATLESGYGFTDGTSHFTRDGSITWTGGPFGWAPYSVNGGPDLYYVRSYLASGGVYSTPPVERVIKTDILLFQYCGDITAAAQEFQFGVPAPTGVELMSFDPVPGDGAVPLEWRTGSELDNLGFHVALPAGRWAIVTSGSRDVAALRLRHAGIRRPAVLVTGQDVPRGKPDPAGYALAASRLGVDARACVAIEDAPVGVAAARAAGARVIALTTTHSAPALAAADEVLDTLMGVRVTQDPGGILRVAVAP